jgi:polyisoprenoid-binding protein YceI
MAQILFLVVVLAPLAFQESGLASAVPVKVDAATVSFEVTTNVLSTTVRGKSTALVVNTQLRDAGDALHLERIEAIVAVASLRTGIKLRDEHMRKYIFETPDGQVPDVRFSAERAQCSQAPNAGTYTCPTSGVLSIRGTARPLQLELKVSKNGDGFKVIGDTSVTLSSYGIDRPSQFGVTTEDTVRIHVELNAKRTVQTTAQAR